MEERVLTVLQGIRPEVDFKSSTSYLEEGLLDSFDLLTLVSDLDASFGISIDGMEILPENFQDLASIVALVERSGGKA